MKNKMKSKKDIEKMLTRYYITMLSENVKRAIEAKKIRKG